MRKTHIRQSFFRQVIVIFFSSTINQRLFYHRRYYKELLGFAKIIGKVFGIKLTKSLGKFGRCFRIPSAWPTKKAPAPLPDFGYCGTTRWASTVCARYITYHISSHGIAEILYKLPVPQIASHCDVLRQASNCYASSSDGRRRALEVELPVESMA